MLSSTVQSNVIKFILDLGENFSDSKALSIKCLQAIEEYGINSPIEQMFLSALTYVIDKEKYSYSSTDDLLIDGKLLQLRSGIAIQPQYEIEQYRVDFRLQYFKKCIIENGRLVSGNFSQLLIELDSREFHDRSEEDRTFEKERGRFLVRKGFKLIRFTGVEIFRDPVSRAKEALEILTMSKTL